MDDFVSLVIGSTASEHITFRPVSRALPGLDDYWNGNWLNCEVLARAGGFSGLVRADLWTEDFVMFRDALRTLYKELRGTATFSTREDWVRVVVTGDGLGHFGVDCTLRDDPGVGNTLKFHLQVDQTQLPAMLTALDGIVRAYPVVGKP